MSRNNDPKVLVVGDSIRDILFYPEGIDKNGGSGSGCEGEDRIHDHTKLHPYFQGFIQDGGAVQLCKYIMEWTNKGGGENEGEISFKICKDTTRPRYISFSLLGKMNNQREGGKNQYLVKKFFGYTEDRGRLLKEPDADDLFVELSSIKDEGFRYLIIHDAGSGFRENDDDKIVDLFSELKPKLILLKVLSPFNRYSDTKLWKEVLDNNADNVIIVTNIDDLRFSGADISIGLSWEKTIEDFIQQISNNKNLLFLKKCKCLIVRIKYDGVIILYPHDFKLDLIFSPKTLEGGYESNFSGDILSKTTIFCSYVFSQILKQSIVDPTLPDLQPTLVKECKTALWVLLAMLSKGYGQNDSDDLDRFSPLIKKISGDSRNKIQEVFSHVSIDLKEYEKNWTKNWTILGMVKDDRTYGEIAYNYVRCGNFISDPHYSLIAGSIDTEGVCPFLFPVYSVGKFFTADRGEIESFQSIRKIISQHLKNQSIKEPLSIAVFGPPGSGKSYGIKEFIGTFKKEYNIVNLTINLSQISSVAQLHRFFHQVRDHVLKNEVPLVFFDEFDCSFEGKEYGWLEHFLAPMQDGEFFEGEARHPIGRAIFIFAGGIHHNFYEFNIFEDPNQHDPDKIKIFKSAKAPDFLSRLRGKIDIIGCNPGDNEFYKIRRAHLLRYFIAQNAPHLIVNNHLRIDQDVLRAFIKTKTYRHGNRSLEAIVKMSTLDDKMSFDPSALPSSEQLNLHVDANNFENLLKRDISLNEKQKDINSKLIETEFRLEPLNNFMKKLSVEDDTIDEIKYVYDNLGCSIIKFDPIFSESTADIDFKDRIYEWRKRIGPEKIRGGKPSEGKRLSQLFEDFILDDTKIADVIKDLGTMRVILLDNEFDLYSQ